MECFSLAYIQAVAADAGSQVCKPEYDDDSVDGIRMENARRRPRIEFQAKSIARPILRKSYLMFS